MSMNQDLQNSMKISSTLVPGENNLPAPFKAEKNIAAMGREDIMRLEASISKYPANGFLRLWLGLVFLTQKQYADAIKEFQHAIHLGCDQQSWLESTWSLRISEI